MPVKSLTKLSDTEIANLLQESNSEPSRAPKIAFKEDLYLFVYTFSLEPGENPVPAKILWQLYKEWSNKPVPIKKFFNFINSLLGNNQQASNNELIYINRGLANISKDLEDYLASKLKYKVKYDSQNKHFTNFLNKYIIEDGKDWVTTSYLFDLYRSWVTRIRKANTLGFEQFEEFCKHYFKFTETKPQTKVAINIERMNVKKNTSNKEKTKA